RSKRDWSSDVCSSDLLEMEFEFIDGLRKTTAAMMDVVEMVLTGHVNPKLTRRVNQTGIKAVGVSGVLEAAPINYERYGLVGEVRSEERRVGRAWRGGW